MLDSLFDQLCECLDGKLKWGQPGKVWTDTVFQFLSDLNNKESKPYFEEREYMNVDYIWRYNPKETYWNDIFLAVEHENNDSPGNILEQEIQHLIDIKAHNKAGIFYPNLGDEKELLEGVKKKISGQLMTSNQNEKYLVILGYSTRKGGQLAIQLKGFFFDHRGTLVNTKEEVILQAKA